MDTFHQLQSSPQHTYKLVQLPADVTAAMRAGSRLEFRASSSSELALVSLDRTWKVRQNNHSNTALLMRETGSGLVGFASTSYMYELVSTDGHMDVGPLPVWDGTSESLERGIETTVAELMANSPISDAQFWDRWHQAGGCEVEGRAVVAADAIVAEFLDTFISLLISEHVDYKGAPLAVDEWRRRVAAQGAFGVLVADLLMRKFGVVAGETFTVDNAGVARWYGEFVLKRAGAAVEVSQFYVQWKSALPPFYSVPLDLAQLRGSYYRPTPDTVRYVDAALLAPDLPARFKQLFGLASQWHYAELAPFVAALVPKDKKLDSVILKFARRKTQAKTVWVYPR